MSFLRPSRSVCMAVVVLAGACAPGPELEPAPGADTAAGPGAGVEATEAGVRVALYADAWDASPVDLGTVLTPVLVRMRNESQTPVAIRYRAFELTGVPGGPHQPIPPFAIQQDVVEPIRTAAYPVTGFELAPYLSPYYPGVSPYVGPFDPDPLVYDDVVFPTYAEIELPTRDMVRFALPEGVLRPGGEATGFLFFPDVEAEGRLRFEVGLIDADTGNELGTVRLPFVARG